MSEIKSQIVKHPEDLTGEVVLPPVLPPPVPPQTPIKQEFIPKQEAPPAFAPVCCAAPDGIDMIAIASAMILGVAIGYAISKL